MDYRFTRHAKDRMKERSISEGLIGDALENPTKVSYDSRGRLLLRKLYEKNGRKRLLLIVVELAMGQLKIVTVIDTSKVEKYL